MLMAERIQALIHKLEVDAGARWLNYLALAAMVVGLAVFYDTHCYKNFSVPEAMDAAQVGRNLAQGRGFTTEFIRPFSVHLLEKHHGVRSLQNAATRNDDPGRVGGPHPDLANAPAYPVLLAGLWKITKPDWKVETRKAFWGGGGRFFRYKPEFIVAIFNQVMLLLAVWLTFLLAKKIFDVSAAWLAAVLMLGSDALWRFSVSGLPTLFLLNIFLGLGWCLASVEAASRSEAPASRRQFLMAMAVGGLVALGMLARYRFGWVIVPVLVFFAVFGGVRRTGLALTSFLVFAALVLPWLARNYTVSGTLFGTAGFAVVEGIPGFPGSRLMRSVEPDMGSASYLLYYVVKLQTNLRYILQEDLFRLGGGWMGILFFAGLLLGLRNTAARRLRYFAVMCLGLFMVVTAMGRTEMSTYSPEINGENLLVLLTPLIIIFGVAFFLTLLNQMNVPIMPIRYAVMGLVVFLSSMQFIMTLLPPKMSPSTYPPYYPPEIQQTCNWMRPDELMMSDIPWAVAWYGDRQCTWTTINSRYEFFQFNDFVKPVRALYLTLNTLDAKLFSECLQGGVDSWGNFAFKTLAANQIPPQFPLKIAPYGIVSGLFLTDHERWATQ